MTDGMRRLVPLGIPGVIAGGVTQINIVIGTIIASLQNGAVSYLYYADRLYELPLAIVGIAIGVVLLPDVSRAPARRQPRSRDGQPEPLARVRHAADPAGRRGAGRGADRDRHGAVRARRLHRGRYARRPPTRSPSSRSACRRSC